MLVKATPALCFDCHMKVELMGRERHGPFKIGMCSSCHSSHQSKLPSLLIGKVPDLCFTCHTTEDFKGKVVHKPVAEGLCYDCHVTHTGQFKNLLKFDGNEVCRKCHEKIFKSPHPATPPPPSLRIKASGSSSGHPIDRGDDPKRPGRKMACVSCHNPHSSDWKGLFRYKADKPADLCQHCHR